MISSQYYVFDETLNPTEKISQHFGVWEFKCKDNSRVIVLDKALVELLEIIRLHYNKPLHVNSGYRTVQYNASLKNSSPKSQHILGKAADIWLNDVSPKQLYSWLDSSYPNSLGIGIYDTFVHVDVREGKSRWDYRTKK
nr:MAG TPA: peptidase [Caudoviricetes sp.]